MVAIPFWMPRIMLPSLQIRWRHMVEPTAPIVPGDEDHSIGPEATVNNAVDLLNRPLHPVRDITDQRTAGIARVRGVLTRVVRPIHPGDGGKLPAGSVLHELV